MADFPERLGAFGLANKLGHSGGYGFLSLGVSRFGYYEPVAGVWHMRMTKRGKRPIKMRFYRPTNPRSETQQSNRNKFSEAMSAWMSLTDEQKADYTKRAKKRGMFGWGLFIREYYQLS